MTGFPSLVRSSYLPVGFLIVACSIPVPAAERPEPAVMFESEIRPILKSACFHCHGEAGELEGGLDVRLVRLLSDGGDSGTAIIAGDREASYLYQRVRDGEMPPDPSHQLTEQQIDLIGRWLDAGAQTLRPEPETLDGPLITEEELAHWSLQPIRRPDVPSVKDASQLRNPIDAFILAKLREHDLTFSPEASPERLARRLAFDLLGLPSTADMVDSLGTDSSPQRDVLLIDRLLASPQYGERWGRHWLDIAGYADSEGFSVDDAERKHAWRYRDYVIRSLNADKPFDQFVREQLAGDEMITSPLGNLTPVDAERLVATGFLRMAPDGTGGKVDDAGVARNATIAETVNIVSSALMGLTIGCAQCHDHRYDPIPHTDYYQFRAIFDPALDWKDWKSPQQRLVSLYTADDRAAAATFEAEAKQIEKTRSEKQKAYIAATFEKELEKLPEEIRQAARSAYETDAKQRTETQKSLLKKHPSLNVTAGSLYLYDRKAADDLEQLAEQAKAIRAKKPVEHFVRALVEPANSQAESFLFARGDHEQPQQKLQPSGLTAVSFNADLPEIPADVSERPTTGRRLAFANRLTNPDHPLLARVIVNRIWMHHFGRGLVNTPADFGTLGSSPSHPELLDWLAAEFIESEWSIKHMHRLILASRTYRQQLRTDPRHRQVDPDNTLFGGARLRRLDAEALRDIALTASGKLVHEPYGPPVPVMADRVGRWVLGIENLNAGRPGDVIPLGKQAFRRSVYIQVRRSRPVAVLDTFDWPRMDPNCDQRRTSTVATQSLMLMNSDFILQVASDFAKRVIREVGNEPSRQVEQVWQIAYGRQPATAEREAATEYLEAQRISFQHASAGSGSDESDNSDSQALSTLCQMVLSSNGFLYVD